MEYDNIPAYNMKVVVRETGLKPDTLRAWERRYGFPEPQRTKGGHRLYSRRDIETIKWVVKQLEKGMSVKRAITLLRQYEEDGVDLFAGEAKAFTTTLESVSAGETVLERREGWIKACLEYDRLRAQQIITESFALFPLETVCVDILGAGLRQIGESWYRGEVTVQQEHFASAFALRFLEALFNSRIPMRTRPDRTIIVGCPSGELHTFSSLVISLLASEKGWDVVYLGADVPLDRMDILLKQVQPRLIVMSANTLWTAANLKEFGIFLAKKEVPLAFGGVVFNRIKELKDFIPGYYLGDDLRTASVHLGGYIGSDHKLIEPRRILEDYPRASEAFQHHRGVVEFEVFRELGVDREFYNRINQYLGNDLDAVLRLGDINLLSFDIEWVQGLLQQYGVKHYTTRLNRYLSIYQKALVNNGLDEYDFLINWFDFQIQRLKQ